MIGPQYQSEKIARIAENPIRGVRSSIKLIDGEKDEFIEGADYPTNGSLHGLPVINGIAFQTTNWKKTYQNLARFTSSELDNDQYKSVIGVPIIIEGEVEDRSFWKKKIKVHFLNQN